MVRTNRFVAIFLVAFTAIVAVLLDIVTSYFINANETRAGGLKRKMGEITKRLFNSPCPDLFYIGSTCTKL
jgi:hypothetical protein